MLDSKSIQSEYCKIMRGIEESGGAQKLVADEYMADLQERSVSLDDGSPVPSFLAPAFITSQEQNSYKNITKSMMRCLEKVIALFQEVPALSWMFPPFAPSVQELIGIDHKYEGRIQCCRLDAFIEDGRVRFCEFNCDTPGAVGWTDQIVASVMQTPAMKALSERYSLHAESVTNHMLQGLLRCYESWCSRTGKKPRSTPRIAIISMNDIDPSMSDMNIMSAHFVRQGYESMVADVREGKYENHEYTIHGRPVEVVVRRGLGSWWHKYPSAYQALKQAYVDGAICMVNPLNSQLGGNKSLFAALQSRRMKEYLTPAEQDLVREYLPWTRVVGAGSTDFHGSEVELMPFIARNRESLVLKPFDLAGGKEVTVGRGVTPETWEESLRVASNGRYVVQEYIPIPTIDVPTFDEYGNLNFEKRNINMSFWAFNGSYAGAFARVSKSLVINVSAGGGILPVVCVHS